MEYQEQLYSDWRSSAAKVFWGIVLTSIFAIFCNFYDMISWIGTLMEMAYEHSQTGETSLYHSKFFLVGVGGKMIIIIGYVLYLVGLTQFAQIQQKESTAHYVYKARTSVILLIITCIISIVFWFVRLIPFIGIFFVFIIWLMYVISYFIMKHAYDGMMMADDFGGRAKLGAKNVRYAAVCQLRLLFMPMVILLVAVLYALLAGASIYGMREELAKMAIQNSNSLEGGALMVILPAIIMIIIAIVCAIIWSICAFIWPMMGWYRIMSDGPADILMVVQQSKPSNADIVEQTDEGEVVATTSGNGTQLPDVAISPLGDVLQNSNKKWYYVGGGVLAALLIGGSMAYFMLGISSNGKFADKPMEEVFPKILKVVEVEVETANLRTSPSTDSPVAIDPMNAQDGVQFLVGKGTRLAVMEEVDEWYKLAWKDKDGADTYIKKSLCHDLITGVIPEDKIYTDWTNKNFECGGGVSVVRQPKGNRLVISYTHIECDADELLLGIYQDGLYLFYYSIPVTGLTYEEHNSGISINKLPDESIFYEGYYGKDMTRKVKYEWGEDEVLDWAKVPEDKLAEFFRLAISEGVKNIKILTARDIKEYQEQKPEEDEGVLSGFSYVVDDGEFGLELYAEIGEKKVATNIAGSAETLSIIDQGDYDNDGEKEALVYEWGGGNSLEPPYLVYYDKDEEVFKKVEGFDYISEDPEIKIEEWNDQTSFVTIVGLRHDRYVYSNHSLSIAERILPDVGTRVATIPLSQLFKVDGDDGVDRSINIDIDGDGSTEKLIFYHDTSHASDWGKTMSLIKIEADNWSIPENEDESLGVTAYSFTFLLSNNGGVPDILCDDAWIYKWDRSRYVMKE